MSSSSTGYEVQGSSLYGGSAKQARLASKKAMNQQPIPAETPVNPDTFKNLGDVVLACPPILPPIYAPNVLETTKKMSKAESNLPIPDRLQAIVLLPTLVDDLFDCALSILRAYDIDWQNPEHLFLLAHTVPIVGRSTLAQTIFAEKDVGNWTDFTTFRATTAILRVALRPGGAIGLHDEDIPALPYYSAAKGGNVIEDGRLCLDETADPKIGCTIEHKAPPAWEKLANLLVNVADMPFKSDCSRTLRFIWPTADGKKHKRAGIETRILIQVWTQMVVRAPDHANISYGILSCGNFQLYLLRKGTTLYISREFRHDDAPNLPTFCWFSLGAKLDKFPTPTLPNADTSGWDDDVTAMTDEQAVGVIWTEVVDRVKQRALRAKNHLAKKAGKAVKPNAGD